MLGCLDRVQGRCLPANCGLLPCCDARQERSCVFCALSCVCVHAYACVRLCVCVSFDIIFLYSKLYSFLIFSLTHTRIQDTPTIRTHYSRNPILLFSANRKLWTHTLFLARLSSRSFSGVAISVYGRAGSVVCASRVLRQHKWDISWWVESSKMHAIV